MLIRHIKEATHLLGAPNGWDEKQHSKCLQLPVRVSQDGYFESAWEPTPAELQTLIAGGSIILRVFGGQPPVSLYVEAQE
jgi:hypothetical protein